MEYNVENDSPVEKKIRITLKPEEVDAAISGAIAINKNSIQLDGYRKGKVPANVIESRFHDQIYTEARENLLNVNINELLQSMDLTPVGEVHVEDGDKPFQRGKEYDYTVSFEVLPKFDLPDYENLPAEQEDPVISDEELKMIYDHVRKEHARYVPVEGTAPAQDGQIVNIDFETLENGQPVTDFNAKNFNLKLGNKQALPEFETLVKGIPVGHTGEGEIHFPEDFLAEGLAGKTLTMKVKVNSVRKQELPELNDELAKSVGLDSWDKYNDLIIQSYKKNSEEMAQGVAKRQLLDLLLEKVDFPLPKYLVDMEVRNIVSDILMRQEQQGKSIKSLGKTTEELAEEAKPRAEELAKTQILLMAIAKKENLEVTPDEVHRNIVENCLRRAEDVKSTVQALEQNGMIFYLRNQMLCDKAMDRVYAKANITHVPEKRAGDNDKDADKEPATRAPDSNAAETGGATSNAPEAEK